MCAFRTYVCIHDLLELTMLEKFSIKSYSSFSDFYVEVASLKINPQGFN